MTETALQLLDEYTSGDNLPAEFHLDPYHPTNDKYHETLRSVHQALRSVSARLGAKKAEAVRLAHRGLTNVEIASRVNVTGQTVGKWLDPNNRDIAEMFSILQYLKHAQDGANIDHRKAVLWRIVVDNEEKRPNIAVQAIQEMNKMTGAYQADQSKAAINITINNELLPKGKLDTLPETFESRRRPTVTIDAET